MPWERDSGLITGGGPKKPSATQELKAAAKIRKRAKRKGQKGLEAMSDQARKDILEGKKTYAYTKKKTAEWAGGDQRRKERARTARHRSRNVAHGS